MSKHPGFARLVFAVAIWMTLTNALLAQTSIETPNDFFKRGVPTFVVGTAGDERADRAIKAQATMIRDLLFPSAKIIDDTAVDTAAGASAWPANPIVYGGPHVNHVLANLQATLPFRMERGKLKIDDQLFEGDEYRLITVVPARPADKDGPGNPAFLLYAGTGMPGVTEINAVTHGSEPILIADAFGRLVTARWQMKPTGGTMNGVFTEPQARRIAWRDVDRKLGSPTAKPITVRINFPKQLPRSDDEERLIEACLRGLQTSADKLQATGAADVSVYVYLDLGSIASLTGERGDGHAVVEARVVHVVRSDPSRNGSFEKLLAHEGTHVLAFEAWGAAGTPLLGEGLAVWASDAYGGVSLADWKRRIQPPIPPVADLLGRSFRQLPESTSYPLAGILVEAAVKKVGVEKVRQHLYGATASTWESACKGAGTTSQELQRAFNAALARK